MGCSPWSHKESDMTEHSTHTYIEYRATFVFLCLDYLPIYIYNVFGAELDFGCYEHKFSFLCIDMLKHFRRTADTSADKVFLLCLYLFIFLRLKWN